MMRLKTRGQALPKAFFIIVLLTAIALQAAFADDEGIRVMARASGTGRAADQVAFAAALARSSKLDAILIAPAGADIVEAASKASCALAVDVTSEVLPGGDARSAWRILDPLTGEVLAEGVVEGREPTARDLAEFWWIAVADAAEAALPKVRKTLVRIEGHPGTVITGQTGKDRGGLAEGGLVIPDSGFLEIPLRVPGTYPWRATSKGAYPERGYFGALEQGVSLAIPRRPIRPWSLEAGLYMGQFPDFWAIRSLGDDRWFLRIGLTQFLAGIYLVDEEYGTETPSVLLSLPLVQPGLGFGGYLLPRDAYVRPYWNLGAFARLLFIKDLSPRFDPVAPMGTMAALGGEWAISGRAAVFFEFGPAFYPFCDGFLMAASRGSSDSGPMWTLRADTWFLELPVMRLGARFSL
ncbi:MAG: hypothetical protein CVV51_00070 [Spirochaetae bacterium HGW-Spirochaetae-7]|nr:MAG: hypothetical protein CVV51_00070 [Spirochaetae bacterium HGW-Spirochaetae-7]